MPSERLSRRGLLDLLPNMISGLSTTGVVELAAWASASPEQARPQRASELLAATESSDDPIHSPFLTPRWQRDYLYALMEDLGARIYRRQPVVVCTGTSRFLQTCTVQSGGQCLIFIDTREGAILQAIGGRVHRSVSASMGRDAIGEVAPDAHFEATGLVSALTLGALLATTDGRERLPRPTAQAIGFLTGSVNDAAFSLNRLAGLCRVQPKARGADRFPDWNSAVPRSSWPTSFRTW